MRVIVLGSELIVIPEGWTVWQTALMRFERRADESIWCRPRFGAGTWRCVSPSLLVVRLPVAKRYCEMCDTWVSARQTECKACGASTVRMAS